MADVTVASTTDSQEEVNQAAGLPAEGATEITGEQVASGATEKEETTVEKSKTETTEEVKPVVKKPPVQKRIDKLTAKNYQQEKEINELKAKLAEKDGSAEKKEPTTEKPVSTAKPKLDDFQTHEDFVEALADWKYEQKRAQEVQQSQQNDLDKQQRETFDAYNRQVSEARGVHDDYDEVVGNDEIMIPQAAQLAIIEMDNGAEVAYYLGKHPEEAEKLLKLKSPLKVAMAIGKISETLKESSAKAEETEETEDAAEQTEQTEETETAPEKPVVTKPVSRAPSPITPVNGANTKSQVPMDELPFSDYKKARAQQEAANRRR